MREQFWKGLLVFCTPWYFGLWVRFRGGRQQPALQGNSETAYIDFPCQWNTSIASEGFQNVTFIHPKGFEYLDMSVSLMRTELEAIRQKIQANRPRNPDRLPIYKSFTCHRISKGEGKLVKLFIIEPSGIMPGWIKQTDVGIDCPWCRTNHRYAQFRANNILLWENFWQCRLTDDDWRRISNDGLLFHHAIWL